MQQNKPVTHISAKLHPELDADLREDIEKIAKRDRSRIYREAVRFYFRHHPELLLNSIPASLPDQLPDRSPNEEN